MPVFHGAWRITVVGVDADWPQRLLIRVEGREHAVVHGAVGAHGSVDAPIWELVPQHHYGGQWHDNVRSTVAEHTRMGGVEQQLIRSKDHDWPHDRRERNIVVRMARAVGEQARHDSDTERTPPTASYASTVSHASSVSSAPSVSAAPSVSMAPVNMATRGAGAGPGAIRMESAIPTMPATAAMPAMPTVSAARSAPGAATNASVDGDTATPGLAALDGMAEPPD